MKNFANWIDLVDALIWPIVVVVAMLVFQDTLKGRLNGLRRFKGGGVEADFDGYVQINQSAQKLSSESTVGVDQAGLQPVVDVFKGIRSGADDHPGGAVLEAWSNARRFVRGATETAGLTGEVTNPQFTSSHVRTLVRLGLPIGFISIATYLNGVRHEVAKEEKRVDAAQAAAYVDSCRELAVAATAVVQGKQRPRAIVDEIAGPPG